MNSNALLILAGLLVAGFVCQWIAWRVKLPSILFLLLTGIVAGPALGIFDPDLFLGDLLEPVVGLAVAVILYEGSLTLKVSEIRGHGAVVRNLVSIGVLVTWVVATFAARVILGWDFYLAALFGAIVTVSGPTVIMPLLRAVRPTRAVASILRWEGIIIDPIGAILAVVVFDVIVVSQTGAGPSHVISALALIVGIGLGLGIGAGHAFGIVLRRHWLPDYLRDYAALALVLLVFSVAETIQPESGLLAVTVMGIYQTNMRDVDLEDILDFKESLTLVLVAALFIILAARIDITNVVALGVGAIGVLAFLQFIAGPLRAFVCSVGSELSWRERLYIGWIFPRGIVAAAVSALFALRLENLGYPGAEKLVPLVFSIIIGTVVIQSLTGRWVARGLGVTDPDPNGVLVIGANPAALAYAEALHSAGRRVMVASMDWDGIRDARMSGLKVFYGSPVSVYADRHLDLMGLGHLLALSHRPGLNELACVRFQYEFGRNAVYTVAQHAETTHEKHQISGESAGRMLFDEDTSLDELLTLVEEGAEIKTTELSSEFTYEDFLDAYPGCLILFFVDERRRLTFPVRGAKLEPEEGSTVTALIMNEN